MNTLNGGAKCLRVAIKNVSYLPVWLIITRAGDRTFVHHHLHIPSHLAFGRGQPSLALILLD